MKRAENNVLYSPSDYHCVSACHESFKTAQLNQKTIIQPHCHILALSLLAPCGHYVNGTCACSVTLWSLVPLPIHQIHLSEEFHSCTSTQFPTCRPWQFLNRGGDMISATPVQSNAISLCSPVTKASHLSEDSASLLFKLCHKCVVSFEAIVWSVSLHQINVYRQPPKEVLLSI